MRSIFHLHDDPDPGPAATPAPSPPSASPAPSPPSAPSPASAPAPTPGQDGGGRLPLVYVRGFAGGTKGIDKQVDDPFYGFNDGSTHVRVGGDGAPQYYQFESPLLRLFAQDGYRPLVSGDPKAYLQSRPAGSVPPDTVWIHRFYDDSADTFGKDAVDFRIEKAAEDLYDLVELVLSRTGAPKVLLVAHSMGGLICRCMIQKISYLPRDGAPRTPGKELVDKLFTYGTPHGGITFAVGGGLFDWVMETFGPVGSDIFSPELMYGYLRRDAVWGDTPPQGDGQDDWRPNVIPADEFPTDRIFCVVGTDPADYGISRTVVGHASDGLVAIENAAVAGAHRAYVHRSHSGRYGLVNSEEGYQNLRRFLFGTQRVAVGLAGLELPAADGPTTVVWQAELQLSVRGLPIVMHEQLAAHCCPIQLAAAQDRQAARPDGVVPLTTVFLLDPSMFATDPLGPPPDRCRYALHLRVVRLEERHGLLFWQDHLAQAADWDDVLVVDVGPRDGAAGGPQQLWTVWNSRLPGAIADHVATEADALGADGAVALPDTARRILGARARLVLEVGPWA
ncbi:esterase/lipase family protein [Kitasatospora sp. NPDC058965]|uniref:esterase/lipase family protein n=1 Tax=Kitasatospora sp. NPDC058965 TaxID=3346682 RepID=UPI00368A125B